MNILISGIGGHMGREVLTLCHNGYRGAVFTAGVDPFAHGENIYKSFTEVPEDTLIDCIIDFSIHTATKALLDFAVLRKIPAVIATTGHTEEENAYIEDAARKIPVFLAANMSLGIAVLLELAKMAVQAFPEADVEIVETHHNRKLDAPSGTALMIANALRTVRKDATLQCARNGHMKRTPEEIGIHAVRRGGIVGIHEILISTESQTLTLKHEAHNRNLFAEGAVVTAAFLVKKPAGLYIMENLVSENQ